MLSLLLALPVVLSFPRARLQGEQETPNAPDPALVQEAVADLQDAFKSNFDGLIVAAIQRRGLVASPEVVACLARGLEHSKVGVRRSAVEALRANALDDARVALERCWEKSERLKGDIDLRERVLKAIADHEDLRSIELFADFPAPTEELPEPEPIEIVRARIRGLGRIRDERALKALMAVFTGFDEGRQRDLLPEFRLSLLVLTGVDHGTNLKAWLRWWEESGAALVVADEPPALVLADRTEWFSYWGFPLELDPSELKPSRRGG